MHDTYLLTYLFSWVMWDHAVPYLKRQFERQPMNASDSIFDCYSFINLFTYLCIYNLKILKTQLGRWNRGLRMVLGADEVVLQCVRYSWSVVPVCYRRCWSCPRRRRGLFPRSSSHLLLRQHRRTPGANPSASAGRWSTLAGQRRPIGDGEGLGVGWLYGRCGIRLRQVETVHRCRA